MKMIILKESLEDDYHNSAQIVFSIDDLLTKIFLLLPLKSLLSFKSVNKQWLTLITNPRFCHLHCPKIDPPVGLFLPSPEDNRHYEYIPFNIKKFKNNKPTLSKLDPTFPDSPPVTILQSCNGLLLCCSTLLSDHSYSVYNPTSNQLFRLPNPELRNGICNGVYGMSLAFDPVKSYYYNVVCVRLFEDTNLFTIDIFCSKTGSWQLFGEPFSAKVNFETGVYWNGAIHWLGIGDGDSLYFNVERKVLNKMPDLPRRYGRNSYFGESCGHLHFIETRGPEVLFDVYEMKRDYSKWFVKYRVDLSQVIRDNPDMVLGRINPMGWFSLTFSVFTIVRGERKRDSFLVLQTQSKVLRFNLVSETFEKLHEFKANAAAATGFLRYPNICGFQFIESLCPV